MGDEIFMLGYVQNKVCADRIWRVRVDRFDGKKIGRQSRNAGNETTVGKEQSGIKLATGMGNVVY